MDLALTCVCVCVCVVEVMALIASVIIFISPEDPEGLILHPHPFQRILLVFTSFALVLVIWGVVGGVGGRVGAE